MHSYPQSSAETRCAPAHAVQIDAAALSRARQKFLRFFPRAFRDETYFAWERTYKWNAHQEWQAQLGQAQLAALCQAGKFSEIAAAAVRIESGRSLLFSFEKLALCDAVRSTQGARIFAEGLYAFLWGDGTLAQRFEDWCSAVSTLPLGHTRVLTWPLVTVFGSIAQPDSHIFFKPLAMRRAAQELAYKLEYASRPGWQTYHNFLTMAQDAGTALSDWRPRDLIDVQSFLWVQGAVEYRR